MADSTDFRQRLIKYIRENDKQYESVNLEQKSITFLVMLKTEIEINMLEKQNGSDLSESNFKN